MATGFVVAVIALAPWALWAVAGQVTSSADRDAHVQEGEQGQLPGTHAGADSYRFWGNNRDGQPLRWDPCAPIRLVVNPSGGPDGWRPLFADAVARVRDASGLDIIVSATTDERPRLDRPAFEPSRWGQRWSPVLVAWASAADTNLPLSSTDRGLAMPLAVGRSGDRQLVSGQLVFNTDRLDLDVGSLDDLSLDFADRASSWGAVMVHELLHLVGLDHVDDPGQLMYGRPGEGPVALGDGDIAGLDVLTAGGCRPAPEPGPVAVRHVTPSGSQGPSRGRRAVDLNRRRQSVSVAWIRLASDTSRSVTPPES